MPEAIVIPFPRSAAAICTPQERLRVALEDLQSALGDQKRAMSNWRFALAELGIGVAGLGQALGSYQESLGAVESRFHGLRGDALRLRGTVPLPKASDITASDITIAAPHRGG